MHRFLGALLLLSLAGCVSLASADQRIGCINDPVCSGRLDPVSQTGQLPTRPR